MLPDSIRLISGPGCPVCVTPSSFIDALAGISGATICVFGDLMRVPGNLGTIEDARSRGRDIRMIYSPLQALEIAREREVMLAAIGFETTIPGIAHTIVSAAEEGIENFSVLCSLKQIPPALNALLRSEEVRVDGFILPGHVCTVLGVEPFEFLPEEFGVGGVITGFEPLDILDSISLIIGMRESPGIHNRYTRVVSSAGNPHARRMIDEVFETDDALWRGLGMIENSGYSLREKYSRFDARRKYNIAITEASEPVGCRCADVLKGIITPEQCPLFAKTCSPQNPVGPCMVSSEGSCAAYYRYER